MNVFNTDDLRTFNMQDLMNKKLTIMTYAIDEVDGKIYLIDMQRVDTRTKSEPQKDNNIKEKE